MHLLELRRRIFRWPGAVDHGASTYFKALLQRAVGPDMQITRNLPAGGIERGVYPGIIRPGATLYGLAPTAQRRCQPAGYQVVFAQFVERAVSPGRQRLYEGEGAVIVHL